MMCDVVLELSDKLVIARESPSFAALMFKSAGSSVQGKSFTSFIEDGLGRQTFESQVIGGTRLHGKVGVCNATLEDGLHNRIHVEVFFVKVEIDTNMYHYLLGIREANHEACDSGIALSRPEPEIRQRKPSEQNGTPAMARQSEFTQAPVLHRRGIKGGLRHPQLKKTGDDARCRSIETCLASWNIKVHRRACCSYHAYVDAAKKSLNCHLAGGPCRKNFAAIVTDGLQCQMCGIIIDGGEEDECDECTMCNSVELKPFCADELNNCNPGTSVEQSEDDASNHLLSL
eukprot:TRINITY_DN18824_c0_g1_i1.p1 TRINITY_DN18824_c0_g1~~TRINITY_DN18824_c0_g1_i1.p1  ORF type:complete len:333 (+),score=38.45 TRINITY_DN18824_c0_g1_i1:139-999(+)